MKKNEEMKGINEEKDIVSMIEGEEEAVVMDEADAEVLDISSEVDTGNDASAVSSSNPRVVMYTQLLSTVLANFKTLQAFEYYIKTVICTHPDDKFAFILHDKDASSVQGQQFAKEHIHLVFQFKNARSLVSLAKLLYDFRPDGSPNVQTLTIFRKKVNNAYSYLCHKTTGASNKFQYSVDEVVANFNYKGLMDKIAREVKAAQEKSDFDYKLYLELLKKGEITMKELSEVMPASLYGANLPKIRNVLALALERKAEQWRKKKQASHRPTTVIWICGKSGTGKSRLGREIVKSYFKDYYIAGSSRGIWEGYQGEHIVLLDELRPNCIESYRDFLSILDAYQERAVAPSRYNDKELMLDVIVVTSVLNPYEFYEKLVPFEDRDIDPFHQLERRVSACVIMDDEWIYNAEYKANVKAYLPDGKGLACNVYSEYKNPDTAVYSSHRVFYDSVFRAFSIKEHYGDLDSDESEDEDTPTATEIERISDQLNEYDIIDEFLETDTFDDDIEDFDESSEFDTEIE